MTKTTLIALSVIILSLISGCMFINVGWNHARIGLLSDYEFCTNGINYVSEDTIGISVKWFPDVDWEALWSKTKNETPQLAP